MLNRNMRDQSSCQMIERLEDRRLFSTVPLAKVANLPVQAKASTVVPLVTGKANGQSHGMGKGLTKAGKGQVNKPTFTTFGALTDLTVKNALQTLAGGTLTDSQKIVVHSKPVKFYSTEILVNGIEKEIAVNADGTTRIEDSGDTEAD